MTDAVKIAVRKRPLTAEEQFNKENVLKVEILNENVLVLEPNRPFIFDKVVDQNSMQKDIYDDLIKPLASKLLKGFYCTVLAYGQTGTGKTYTMGLQADLVETESAGIIPRALLEVLQHENTKKVSISFIEIYNEKAFDLLDNDPKIQINVKGCKFSGATKRQIHTLEDAYKILVEGNKNRHVRPTKMNPNSSRSHAIFTILVDVERENGVTQSAMHLVDLAGSEGVRRTSHKGAALVEGVHINQGLLCIAKVTQALSSGAKVIPYRDSVLSTVLQDSLNANSYITLLACISPLQKDFSETMSTLRFARNTKTMKNTPQINSIIAEYKKSRTPIKALSSPPWRPSYQTPSQRQPLIVTSTVRTSSAKQRFSTPTNNINKSIISRNVRQSEIIARPAKKELFDSNLSRINTMNLTNNSMGCATFDISTSTVLNEENPPLTETNVIAKPVELPTNEYSPIIRRCMKEFETIVDRKMVPIFNTVSMLEQQQTTIRNETRPVLESIQLTAINDEENNETLFKVPLPPKVTIKPKLISNRRRSELERLIDGQPIESIILDEIPFAEITNTEMRSSMPRLNMQRSGSLSGAPVIAQPAAVSNVRRSRRLTILEERKSKGEREKENSQNAITNNRKKRVATKRKSSKFTISKALDYVNKANSSAEAIQLHREYVLKLLNTGEVKDLEILSNIGPKTAFKIIMYRSLHGEFKDIESISELPWSERAYEKFMVSNNLK